MPSDHTPDELRHRFWEALRNDRIVMLGVPGHAQGRPMSAQTRDDQDRGPIWFFTASDTELGAIEGPERAELAFVSKGHEVFATAHGTLRRDDDRATIDALWSRYVEAWFDGGKDDPKLRLMRFDGDEAEIWLGDPGFLSGSTILVSAEDPGEDFRDNEAKVAMR